MCFYLPHPVLESIEGGPIIHSVHHNDTHCSFIICLGYGFESLLAGSIPDLQSYFFAINFNRFYFEIYSYGC